MIATQNLFERHFYTFGGTKYHQRGGGPIGLRATCAIARVVMQLWDRDWKNRLRSMGVVTWMVSRYMDDGRAFLPPFRHGWRWGGDDVGI